MRLIHAKTLQLVDFTLSEIPPYAILSHTWAREEVTFQDMSDPAATSKRGYEKIKQTCRLALEHNLEYAWCDTCCIDKSSSAELSEAINSMFRWYRDAKICFAYLEDLELELAHFSDFGEWIGCLQTYLPECRWFTRGWTLQELLAPKSIKFNDGAWKFCGIKDTLRHLLASITNIPHEVLGDPEQLLDQSVAEKMSWAAHRSTTRLEDIAYCLLGIFDVNMPLIYGEGNKAFQRLQEEIIRRSNDPTILAWDTQPEPGDLAFMNLLAPSPRTFAASKGIRPTGNPITFAVTDRGLLVNGDNGSVPLRQIITCHASGKKRECYFLSLGYSLNNNRRAILNYFEGGIALRKTGFNLFCRDGEFPLIGFGKCDYTIQVIEKNVPDYTIFIGRDVFSGKHLMNRATHYRDMCIHVPPDSQHARLKDVAPLALWDVRHRAFLWPSVYESYEYLDSYTPTVVIYVELVHRGRVFHFHALFRATKDIYTAKLFPSVSGILHGLKLIGERGPQKFVLWPDAVRQYPEIEQYSDVLSVGPRTSIRVRFERRKHCFEPGWPPSTVNVPIFEMLDEEEGAEQGTEVPRQQVIEFFGGK